MTAMRRFTGRAAVAAAVLAAASTLACGSRTNLSLHKGSYRKA